MHNMTPQTSETKNEFRLILTPKMTHDGFTKICGHTENRMIIATIPFGLIDHLPDSEESFPWYNHVDAANQQLDVATRPVMDRKFKPDSPLL